MYKRQLTIIETKVPGFSRTQCLEAIKWAQGALNKEEDVVLMDGKNAFNELLRQPVLRYMATQRFLQPLYNLINLLYCTQGVVIAYRRDGLKAYEVPITRGARQGCVTGSLFLKIALDSIDPQMRGVLAPCQFRCVADDIALAGSSASTRWRALLPVLKQIGLDYDSDKTRILTPTADATKYLGGMLVPAKASVSSVNTFLDKILDKARARTIRAVHLDTSIQNRLGVLRLLPFWLRYYVLTAPQEHAKRLATVIDQLHLHAVQTTVKLAFPPDHVRYVFHHIEDGGLGMYPLELLASNQSESHLHQQWRAVATHPVPQPPRNWLTSWPKNRFCIIQDDAIQCFVALRCGLTETQPDRILPCGQKFTDPYHPLTCNQCNPPCHWHRHEAVLYSLMATLRFHNIQARKLRHENPLPGNSRGGADLQVFFPGVIENVDVTVSITRPMVTTHNALAAYNRKVAKYAAHVALTAQQCTPFAMSSNGYIENRTLKRVNEWAGATNTPKETYYDIIVHTQIALIHALHRSLMMFRDPKERPEAVARIAEPD